MRVWLALAGWMCGFAAAQAPLAVPVEIQIPVSPAPFASKGKLHYVYEIHLANFDRRGRAVTLSSVEVLSDRGKQLAKLAGEDLTKSLMQPGLAKRADVRQLPAGRHAVLFMWVSIAEGDPRPASLQHRFVVAVKGVAGDNTLECCHTAIPGADPLVIGPPLRGGGWLAGNGPSNASEHRRALLTLDGHAYLAQRFAIDWIQFGKNGELAVRKGTENRDYASYGAEVLAVASGRVVGLKDGIIENKPESLAVPITIETIAGNFVSLDLGNGRYAHYAHLQPGSLRVKVGDHVKPGQILGLLGNSGNSDAPHLHFQITDGPSFLASEGMPYSLPSFVEEGQGPEFKFEPASAPTPWRNQLPVNAMVVRFP
ncbi:MAG: M23 family metallopeptidase [Acidobacteriia bacterium]|nr:M23 family metallopeptidase [Terriglobia bacterium]